MSFAPVLASLAVVAGATGTIIRASTHSRATLWGPVCWQGPCGAEQHQVALTFDDGPTPESTQAVLETLERLEIRATFFVIGRHVQASPKLLQQVHEAGHLIANHTYDHSHTGYLHSTQYWLDQIERTGSAVEAVVGVRPRFFRTPMGVRTWRTTAAVRQSGVTLVTWTRRALDGLPTTADEICKRLLPGAAAGDILLLHDGIEPGAKRNPQATVEALPRIASALREQQLMPVRLDKLLGVSPYLPRAPLAGV